MIARLEITITKTATGIGEYVQIQTPGTIPLNIVLIADEIVVNDMRERAPIASKKETRRAKKPRKA